MRNGIVFGSVRNASQAICEINITPLVDVLLVLTVLFIFVTPLLTTQVEANSLRGCFHTTKPSVTRIVDIFASEGNKPHVELDGLAIGAEQLALEMQLEARKGREEVADVYIRTSPDASYSHMAKILALVNKSGIRSVYLDEFSGRGPIPEVRLANRYSLIAN